MEQMSMTHILKSQQQNKEQYIVKSYIMANEFEYNMYKRELQIHKIVLKQGLAAKLSWSHNDVTSEGIILNYNSHNLHKISKSAQHLSLRTMKSESQHQIKKYLIISKRLDNGMFMQQFIDNKFDIMQPFQRFSLISKLLKAVSQLENMGIYHGQLLPQHIFIHNLESLAPQTYQIKFTDFSESIDINNPQIASFFEAAVYKQELLPQWRDPHIRGYVPFALKDNPDLRMFLHPLLGYFKFHYQSLPAHALRYDIRKTDKYSLIMLILILSSPNSETKVAVTRLLEKYTDFCVQMYATNKIKKLMEEEEEVDEIRSSAQQSFLSQAIVLLRKSYSQHHQIQQSVRVFLDSLREQLQESLMISDAGKKAKRVWGQGECGMNGLMSKLFCDLNPIIDFFQGKEFRMDRSVSMIIKSGHQNLRQTLVGVLHKKTVGQQQSEGFMKLNIFDKFFGEEWIDLNERNLGNRKPIFAEEEKYREVFSEVKEEQSEIQTNGISSINNKSLVEKWNKQEQPGGDSQIQISFLSKVNESKQEQKLLNTQRSDQPDIKVQDFTEREQLILKKEQFKKSPRLRSATSKGALQMINSLKELTPRKFGSKQDQLEEFSYRGKYEKRKEAFMLSGAYDKSEEENQYSQETDGQENVKMYTESSDEENRSHLCP